MSINTSTFGVDREPASDDIFVSVKTNPFQNQDEALLLCIPITTLKSRNIIPFLEWSEDPDDAEGT